MAVGQSTLSPAYQIRTSTGFLSNMVTCTIQIRSSQSLLTFTLHTPYYVLYYDSFYSSIAFYGYCKLLITELMAWNPRKQSLIVSFKLPKGRAPTSDNASSR